MDPANSLMAFRRKINAGGLRAVCQRYAFQCNFSLSTFTLCRLMNQYSLSNVIPADEKFTVFHQYLRYSLKCGTIVFSIPGVIL